MKSTDSILKVLDYTKSNKKWFDDKELIAGYHSVRIDGDVYKGQRDPEKRLAKVGYEFKGKRVLDVGCSNGGLLHALSDQLSFGVGVDFNSKCINAANALKAVNHIDNIHFYTFDLDKENIEMLRHFVLGEPVDICFFFNISIWVKRWKEVFSLCSELSETMLFEAHGSDEQQDEQLAYVQSVYQNVLIVSEKSDDDPTYAKRKMYICTEKLERHIKLNAKDSRFLDKWTEDDIKNVYQEVFPKQSCQSISIFPNTHESVVADIDGSFIVKFPRPSRSVEGLVSEQIVTDFMRDKLEVLIPEISLHEKPVFMGRYQKLHGEMFDKKRYKKLSNTEKNQLAAQMAESIFSFHKVTNEEMQKNAFELDASWSLSTELVKEQLSSENEHVFDMLLNEVVKNHESLEVPKSNEVFGHFDLHGGNILLDSGYKKLVALLDFGNCKIGDLHQDLSVMNLSSPDLAERIAKHYESISGRKLNRLLIQHYTTIFYLNLLAGLKRSKSNKKYKYWLGELNTWYDYLLRDRAKATLSKNKPISTISPNWRKWLASSLMKGSSAASLQKILRAEGFSDIEVAAEMLSAESHPYTEAGQEIFKTLQKRNWLMKTCDSLAQMDDRYSTEIEKRKVLPFKKFIKEYYSKHLPVVFTQGVDHWPALKKWTPEYLSTEFGDKEIEVQYGRDQDALFERNSGKHKKKMRMHEFADLIKSGESSNNYYMTANNTKNSFSTLESLFEDVGDFGKGYRQKDTIQSGNFLWFGPKGTFTPLHHDLTNNMLVQIYGRKKVTLIPALQVSSLYNDKGVYSATDFPDIDMKKHPLMENATPMEIIIEPGDALFIPIGWWHCVESLDVSISLSFTNFNIENAFSNDFPRN